MKEVLNKPFDYLYWDKTLRAWVEEDEATDDDYIKAKNLNLMWKWNPNKNLIGNWESVPTVPYEEHKQLEMF